MKTVFGNLSIRAIVFAMIVMGPICAYAQTSGTTVSLDGNTGKLLLSEGAGSDATYSAFWKHEQAPIQLVMTNCAKGEVQEFNGTSNVFHGINSETGLFTTLPNNMAVESDKKLAIYNWATHYDCSYFAIIAPKGFRILRYIIDADVSGNENTANVDFREYHLAEHATVIVDDDYAFQTTANGSSTVIDRVLDYSSPRLYFKVKFASTAAHSFKFTSFKIVYTIDKPFEASLPNTIDGVATNKFGSGIINLGAFGTNSKSKWTFTSSNVNALSEIEVYDVTENKDLDFAQVNGSPYYFTASNGDYMMEAPKQFRIVGAKVNFLNISTGGAISGYEAGEVAIPESGKQYLIKDADGNYISYIDGALTTTTDARTAWTVTTSGSGYTISIGGDSGSGSSVETGSINVTTGNGTLYKGGSTTGQTWNDTWKSTSTTPQVTLKASANNMTGKSSGYLALASGQAKSSTYTITIDEGYVITGFSAKVSGTAGPTITAGGTTYNVTTSEQTVSVTGLNSSTATFTMGGDNNEVLFSDFVISYQTGGSDSSDDSSTRTTTVTCVETTSRAATLFDSPTTYNSTTSYYRIPAIAKLNNGNLLAISDLRIGGSGDIGTNIPINIVAKKSTDNGANWGTESTIIAGGGSTNFDYAHGDAAVVADSETGKIILLAASGKTGYGSGGVQLGQYYSTDNGATWTGNEITSAIKSAFTSAGLSVSKQFFTSGRIIQSKKVKVGTSYRIYSALCTGNGSIVMYSDDFGGSWAVLGSKVAYSGGDETVLEELPNGDLLLSARLSGSGRGFAVYNYSNLTTGAGSWSSTTTGISQATNCNGEMLLVPTSNSNVYVLLHSVSLSGRTNVTIYYKLIDTTATVYNTPSFYSSGWEVFKQVSTTTSAYSTMVLDNNNEVAFLYEENLNGGYDIVFKSFKVNVTFPEEEQGTDPNIPSTKTYLVHSDTGLGTSTTAEVWEKVSGDLWHVQTGTSTETVSSITSGNAYYITNGSYYLSLNSSNTIVATTEPTTLWTFTKNGNSWRIKSGDYYLRHQSNSLSASTSNNNNSWTYNNHRLSYTSGNTYYLRYNNGWSISSSNSNNTINIVTTTPTYSSNQTLIFFDIASTKYAEDSTAPYTAKLYDKRGETSEESKSESVEHNTPVTLTLDDLNNDAIKFNISDLATGQKALFNVELDLLPLDPHIQTVNVSVNANGKVYNRVVNSLNYEFSDDGEPLAISISDEDYVADNCFLFFQDAFNENENSTNIGNGKSNFFLMGSTFDMYTRDDNNTYESGLRKYKSPLPSKGDEGYPSEPITWNSTYLMGANKIPFTNIDEFTTTSGPDELLETDFYSRVSAAGLNYDTSTGELDPKKFTEAASNTLNVYIYSCDIPVYNLTENEHIAYRFYDVKAKLEVVYEEPVVEVTPIYNSTLKGKNNKKATITADKAVDSGHKFVGIKVTSKVKDGQTGTALGHLNSTEIINAIKTAITDYAYSSEDLLRGILYVDMSALKSVTTRDAETDPWDAFHQGTADNCLYFMPSGFNRNVENTIKGGENGEALGNIIIKDKQPFYTPYKFKTGTYYAIYNREITGGTSTKAVTQSTLVLPFDVTLNEGKAVDAKNEEATEPEYITYYSLGALGEKASENGKVWGVTATPLDATVAKANTPYHISTENPLTACSFAIKQVNANFVASTSNTDGSVYEYNDGSESNWKAYGSYCGEAVKTTDAKTGETFYYSKDLYWKSSTLTTTDKFYILPFRAYFESIEAVQDGVKTFSVFLEDYNDATDIESVETGNTVGSSDVYTLQGTKVKTQGLKRGIYIVGGKKIYVNN